MFVEEFEEFLLTMIVKYFQQFIISTVIVIFFEFIVVFLFIKNDFNCNMSKKFSDVVLINCITCFLSFYMHIFIKSWNQYNVCEIIHIIALIIILICIPIIEAKYYAVVWDIQFKRCLKISVVSNVLFSAGSIYWWGSMTSLYWKLLDYENLSSYGYFM